jgi:cytochrome c oxidase subunit III
MAAPATVDNIPVNRRPSTLFVATGLAIAGGVMLVAALVGIHLALRNQVDNPAANWVPRRVQVPNAELGYAVFTAVLSSITAQWVVRASRHRERGLTLMAVGVTILLGVAWINMFFFAFDFMDLSIGSSAWADLAFTLSGVAVALGMVAIAFLALMTLRALGGEEGDEGTAPLAAAVFFWHFSVAALVALWYVVYVVK